ncbi:MAG: S-layer homology domain-containing protein [Peptococcaceae bacterium]|nr:S-layer homology domain-containing protein [Peptococcaceae bacterium]
MEKSAASKLAACLLASSLVCAPLPSWAETAPAPKAVKVAGQSAAPADNLSMPLEKAIAIAREKVAVPADLDMFSSEYGEYNGKGRWMLRWYNTKTPEASMYVTVNAATGALENINYYRGIQPGVHYKGLPRFSRDQCLEIARKEGARLAPDKFPYTVPASREQWENLSAISDRDYPVVYNFNFKRTESGIPVSDQGIGVGINAETGELVRFDCNWNTDVKFPSPEGRISPDQARKIFLEKAGLELTYFMAVKGDPDVPGELRPVYRQKPPARFILNALTGEVMNNADMDFFFDEVGGADGAEFMYSRAKKADVALTPAEEKAVKEIRDLISADQAQETAAKLVEVPAGYTVTGRSLERNYGVPGSREWSIRFSDKEKKKWIHVSVDARSGDLISFSREEEMDPGEYYKEPQVKVSEEEAKKIAGELIKKLRPDRFGQVVFRQSEKEMGPWVKTGKTAPRGYMLEYARMVNGVVYPENGFRIRVNSTTGEVTSYRMIWWDTAFPSVQGVIDTAAANEKFLAGHPLTLEYCRVYERWGRGTETPQYYLVYSPVRGSGVMLDARSGQEIDYQGNPVVKREKQPFTDISGHPAEQDILLLAREGIISGEGGKFRPDDRITVAENLAMLVKAYGRGSYRPLKAAKDAPWYESVIDSARAMGILDNDFSFKPGDGLNRLQLCRLGINAGGWGKLARLQEIFRLDVADAGSVPAEYRGYVASAVAMGLIDLENGKFSPDKGVTRAEAAVFLVKLLKQ